ncbi:ABC transporter permease [Ilumatobacter sp.]|uniref:ABC transporter permease n=1 Tax=Ilumatobacter sp. TaxID=1967498 RepID=UPI003B529BB8
MLRFALRRAALALITLFILVVVVFILTRAAPGDTAQRIAGPFASQQRVDEVRDQFGLGDSLPVQFLRYLGAVVTLDFGVSFADDSQSVMGDVIRPALWRSTKLVMLALVMTIPISILGGVVAARKKDTYADRSIVNLGLASASIPEFVSGVILQYLLGVRLKREGFFGFTTDFFPAITVIPNDAGALTEIRYLLLPALAIVLVYFGYIARVTRAGTITALDADYARTAYMKGLGTRKVVRRHILRNALQPTVAVTGTQVGYLFGGLVALEVVFEYNGLGRVILDAALLPNFPVVQAGVIVVAIIFMITTLLADLLIAYMNPRARLDTGAA